MPGRVRMGRHSSSQGHSQQQPILMSLHAQSLIGVVMHCHHQHQLRTHTLLMALQPMTQALLMEFLMQQRQGWGL
jgi:hypothetical protein